MEDRGYFTESQDPEFFARQDDVITRLRKRKAQEALAGGQSKKRRLVSLSNDSPINEGTLSPRPNPGDQGCVILIESQDPHDPGVTLPERNLMCHLPHSISGHPLIQVIEIEESQHLSGHESAETFQKNSAPSREAIAMDDASSDSDYLSYHSNGTFSRSDDSLSLQSSLELHDNRSNEAPLHLSRTATKSQVTSGMNSDQPEIQECQILHPLISTDRILPISPANSSSPSALLGTTQMLPASPTSTPEILSVINVEKQKSTLAFENDSMSEDIVLNPELDFLDKKVGNPSTWFAKTSTTSPHLEIYAGNLPSSFTHRRIFQNESLRLLTESIDNGDPFMLHLDDEETTRT